MAEESKTESGIPGPPARAAPGKELQCTVAVNSSQSTHAASLCVSPGPLAVCNSPLRLCKSRQLVRQARPCLFTGTACVAEAHERVAPVDTLQPYRPLCECEPG